jgi:hypothetical protein
MAERDDNLDRVGVVCDEFGLGGDAVCVVVCDRPLLRSQFSKREMAILVIPLCGSSSSLSNFSILNPSTEAMAGSQLWNNVKHSEICQIVAAVAL